MDASRPNKMLCMDAKYLALGAVTWTFSALPLLS